ncbi:MAG: ABC transporter ATP-binding protein [Patescibacteria group bacterium]
MGKKFEENLKGLRILWKYLSVYRRELTLLSVLGVFSAIANGSVPYVTGKFLDAILVSHTVFEGSVFAMPLWVLLLAVWGAAQLVAIGTDWKNDRMARRIEVKIFIDYYANAQSVLLHLPLWFHKNAKSGDVSSTINRAANSLDSIVGQVVIILAPQFLSIIIGMMFAFFMNPFLGTILLSGILIYVILLFRMIPQATPFQINMHKGYRSSFAEIGEVSSNILSVKQFGSEAYHHKRIVQKFGQALKFGVLINNIWSNVGFSQRTIVVTTQVIIFILSVYLIQASAMTIGELLAFNGYAALVFGPFVILGRNWQTLQNGLVALEAAEKILEEKPEDYAPVNAVKNFDFQGAIKFDNVSFGYKKSQKVLDGISFETKPGEMVALVGESGAGKSTLIDLISGYYFPTAGRVTIDGHSTRKINLGFLRKNIAIVPQEVALFHDTVKMNIAYGSFGAKSTAIKEAAKVAHADQFIEGFPKKYDQVVGERGVKLSVGQKQRIAIARAVLRDPKILILDEPTSALDSETEKYVTEALNTVMAGRTTFVIAHRLSTVRRADKILVLEKGKIAEAGTHDELMQIEGGNYRRRYELHVGLV